MHELQVNIPRFIRIALPYKKISKNLLPHITVFI